MVDKCSKKDCVDFDVLASDMDLAGNCNVCRNNRRNPTWVSDEDQYLKVENIVDPTADISAPTNVMKGIDDSFIKPAVDAMEAFNREASASHFTPIPTRKDRRGEPAEIPEETYDALSNAGSAKAGIARISKSHLEDVPPRTNGYTIREGLKHNEVKKDIKDSGSRTMFETGAERDAQGGKGRFDLLPLLAVWALAHHTEKGCTKYGDRNWEKGIPIKNYIDSAERHLKEFQLGLTDENHMAAALWNIACCYETLVRIDMGVLPRSLDQDIPYILRGVVKNSEEVKPWDRMRYPLREAK